MPSVRRPLILFLLLTALGFAGNWANVEMFFGVNQVFGSVFTLLAAWALGPWWGALSAALAHSYTIHLWGHPWAYLSFVAETLAVGLLLRRQVSLLYADALYWIFGVLLVPLFYGVVMGLAQEQVLLIALKQPANGLFNALAAGLLTQVPRLWRPFLAEPPRLKVQELFTQVIMSFLFFSLYVSANLTSAEAFRALLHQVSSEVSSSNGHLAAEIEAFTERHRQRALRQLAAFQEENRKIGLNRMLAQEALYWARADQPPRVDRQAPRQRSTAPFKASCRQWRVAPRRGPWLVPFAFQPPHRGIGRRAVPLRPD